MTQSDLEKIAHMVTDMVGRQYLSARKSDSEFWGDTKIALRSLLDRAGNVDTTLKEIKENLETHRKEIDALRLWRSAITAGISVILIVAVPLASRAFSSLEKSISEVKQSVQLYAATK